MKKFLVCLIMCLSVFTLVLTGCNTKATVSDVHSSTDEVYGNGGMAVIKGDYVYFANAYKSQDSVGYNKNQYGDETLSALYRVKLNEDGLVDVDEDGMPVGAEIVVKQLVGYENSNIYIYGDYIYYTTPKTFKDDNGNNATGYVSFNRVKLNGANHQELVTYKDKLTSYSIAKVGDNVVLTALTTNNDLKTTVVSAKGKVSNKTIDTSVTGVVLPEGEIQADTLGAYVYYTKAVNLNDDGQIDGNKVCKANIYGGEKEVLIKDGKSYTLNTVANNRLYYTDSDSILRSTDLDEDVNIYSYNTMTSFYAIPNDLGDVGVVGTIASGSYNVLVYAKNIKSGHSQLTVLADGVANSSTYTILFVTSSTVVYTDGTNCYSKEIFTDSETKTLSSDINLTIGTGTTNYFDYDDNYMYYYDTVEASNGTYNYLHMIKYGENEANGHLIGALDSSDIKIETESDDAE